MIQKRMFRLLFLVLGFLFFEVDGDSYYRSVRVENYSSCRVKVCIVEAGKSLPCFFTIEPGKYIVRRFLSLSQDVYFYMQDEEDTSSLSKKYCLDSTREIHTVTVKDDGVSIFSESLS